MNRERVTIVWSEEDNAFLAYTGETIFRGMMAHGDTRAEALSELEAAMALCELYQMAVPGIKLTPCEEGGFTATCDIPGAISQGETEAEALENLRDAVEGLRKVRNEL